MEYWRQGPLEFVTRITGPTHHPLGLELTEGPLGTSPIFESVSLDGSEVRVERFNGEKPVCREVLEGIETVNQHGSVPLGIKTIRICRDDSYQAGVYRRLAEMLAEHHGSRMARGAVKTSQEPGGHVLNDVEGETRDDETLAQIADRSIQEYDARDATRDERSA